MDRVAARAGLGGPVVAGVEVVLATAIVVVVVVVSVVFVVVVVAVVGAPVVVADAAVVGPSVVGGLVVVVVTTVLGTLAPSTIEASPAPPAVNAATTTSTAATAAHAARPARTLRTVAARFGTVAAVTTDPARVVDAMIAAIERRDLDAAIDHFTDDVEYDNVPMGAVHGHDGVRTALAPFLGRCTGVEWRVLRQAATGDVVMNERVDRFEIDGRWREIAVAGVFVVRDGRIALWRDYFDLAAARSALG